MASASKDKAKSKKVPGSKERGEIVVNPDEPLHEYWSKISPFDFERDRLEFNPYDFGQRTSSVMHIKCIHELCTIILVFHSYKGYIIVLY